jgi:ribosomal protein L2
MTKISYIEPYSTIGSKYVRSAGSFAIFINVNMDDHTSLIELPSGTHKAFSFYSLAFLGSVSMKEKEHFKNTKSGY